MNKSSIVEVSGRDTIAYPLTELLCKGAQEFELEFAAQC